LASSSSDDRTVKLWLVSEEKELRTLPGYNDVVRSLAFSPDGRRLVSGGLVWNLAELFETFPPVGVEPQIERPARQTTLLPNFPNPFNAETWMPYALSQTADVQIGIYDTQGHLVRLLELGHRAMGRYVRHCDAAHWDGRNDAGEPVTSGVYFYSLQAGDFRATRKLVLKK
jgi:WD40 repeat protein